VANIGSPRSRLGSPNDYVAGILNNIHFWRSEY